MVRDILSSRPRPTLHVSFTQVITGLHAELDRKGVPIHAAGFALHAASAALRQQCARSLSTPLQAVLAPAASESDMATMLLSARREDRKVRLALCTAPVDLAANAQADDPAAPSDVTPAALQAVSLGFAVHLFELQLPVKNKFAEDNDEDESEEEATVEGGAYSSRLQATLEASTVATLQAALQAALLALDNGVDFQKLRGVDVAVAAIGTGTNWASALQLQRSLLLALADRNHVRAHSHIVNLLNQPLPQVVGAPNEPGAVKPFELGFILPPPPKLFWDCRWQRKRSQVSYVALRVEQESDDDEQEKLTTQDCFVPFGSVIAASGRSVRVSISISAGLAAELPLWGMRMRGDAEWAVRALRPDRVVVIQEGEHALVQAELLDADGKGVPSSERLLRAVLFATPALSPELQRAVALQRVGSLVQEQQGQMAPLLMPKREAFIGFVIHWNMHNV